jgi:hypothetical protein
MKELNWRERIAADVMQLEVWMSRSSGFETFLGTVVWGLFRSFLIGFKKATMFQFWDRVLTSINLFMPMNLQWLES